MTLFDRAFKHLYKYNSFGGFISRGASSLSLSLLIVGLTSIFVISCRQQERFEHPEYFNNIILTAYTLKDHNDKNACMQYLDSAYNAFPSPGIIDLYNKYNFKRGWVLELEANYAEANAYCDSMLLLFEDQKRDYTLMKLQGMALLSKGEALIRMAKFNEAFASYHSGKLLIEQLPNMCEVSGIYSGQIGTGYYIQGDFQKAIAYYQQSIRELSQCDALEPFVFIWQIQGMLDNIALSYSKQNMPDSAQHYFQKALDFITLHEDQFTDPNYVHSIQRARGVIYGNRGDVYLQTGDSIEAEAMWKASAAINLNPGSEIKDGQVTQAKLAEFYLSRGQWALAHETLQHLRTSLDSFTHETVELQYYHLSWKYYEKTRQLREAFTSLKYYSHLRDSLYASPATTPVDIDAAFERLELKHQQALYKKEATLQNLSLILISGFALFILLILFLLWRNWRRIRAYVVRLKEGEHVLLETKSALEQSKYLLDATQALSKTGGWEYNLTTQQFFWTRQMYSLYEVSESFVPTVENNLAFYDARYRTLINELSAESIQFKRPFSMDVQLATRSEQQKWLRLLMIPIVKDNQVISLRGAVMDITLLKKEEFNLMHAKEALERSNQDMQRILKVVAHDLRSPIGGITGLSSLLLMESNRSAEDIKMLNLIQVSSEYSSKLIAEILSLDFMENYEATDKEQIELKPFLQQAIDLLQFAARDKQQVIELTAEANLYGMIVRDKMLRVMNNLLGNALKFSPANSTIVVSLIRERTNVIISVRDQGLGIPPVWGNSIFDMFTKNKRPGTAGEKSFGLGLSISKKIVEIHGGKIWFENNSEKGTTFYVMLPVKDIIS